MARHGRHVRPGRRRHRRAPLRVVRVTLGGGLGQQRPGRLAVGCQLHRPARRPRRLRVARRGQVQARLEQIALGRPRIAALGELVDDPLRARDVAHLEQQQPDLDPRADARAGRIRRRDAGSPRPRLGHPPRPGRRPPAAPADPSAALPGVATCETAIIARPRPAAARRQRPEGTRRVTRLVHGDDGLDPAQGRATEWGRWAPRRWVIDISPAGWCDPDSTRTGQCRARSCMRHDGRSRRWCRPTVPEPDSRRSRGRSDRSSPAALGSAATARLA